MASQATSAVNIPELTGAIPSSSTYPGRNHKEHTPIINSVKRPNDLCHQTIHLLGRMINSMTEILIRIKTVLVWVEIVDRRAENQVPVRVTLGDQGGSHAAGNRQTFTGAVLISSRYGEYQSVQGNDRYPRKIQDTAFRHSDYPLG